MLGLKTGRILNITVGFVSYLYAYTEKSRIQCAGRYPEFSKILNHIIAHRRARLFCTLILLVILWRIYCYRYKNFNKLFPSDDNPLQKFEYPPYIDLDAVISHYRFRHPLPNSLMKIKPSNPRNFHFKLGDLDLCDREQTQLLILVKTTHKAASQRIAIRNTWGNSLCFPKFRTRVLFLLGLQDNQELQNDLETEEAIYGDILQQNFHDNYYNNTLKMMMGFEYLSQHCSTAEFFVLIDHDYILDPSGLAKFISTVHPRLLPRFLAGYVWYAATPKREADDKWRQSQNDYPFEMFPNYAEAGTLIVSSEFARDLYIAMQFTKFHKFDDIFLGIILHKLHIAPVHSRQILHLRPKKFPSSFISSHGFDTGDEIQKFWKKSKLVIECHHEARKKRRRE